MKSTGIPRPKKRTTMINPTELPEPAVANGSIDESQNVEQIRNILFGSQMRDYDGRFQKLEERLTREAEELRTDLQKRLDALEAFMRGESESLANRLGTEQAERSQATERLGRDLGETTRHFEEKITKLDGHMAKETREVRQQLLDQSKT